MKPDFFSLKIEPINTDPIVGQSIVFDISNEVTKLSLMVECILAHLPAEDYKKIRDLFDTEISRLHMRAVM